YTRLVVWVRSNQFDPPPVRQALRAVTEVFDSGLIQGLELAFRSPAPHECRDGLDQETKLTLTLAKRFFRPLALVFRSFVLGKLLRQSLVGRDQFVRSTEQNVHRRADGVRRLALGPQRGLAHEAEEAVAGL